MVVSKKDVEAFAACCKRFTISMAHPYTLRARYGEIDALKKKVKNLPALTRNLKWKTKGHQTRGMEFET